MKKWGLASGNPVWHLPHEGYEDRLKCDEADIANVQPSGSKDAGASVGAAFVAEAVKATGFKGPFVHLDVAATATAATGTDGLYKGTATGTPVPLLMEILFGLERA